eukprot:TRINITY_DN9666_c0_g1_i1.p1 TRINITY_DN9666_c0_g1~~TRINITY_DN9666_c0_g1_i1.p1  ORF type:complete len:336 (-),score=29.07 TRINITY_DN9666_c0_g1_i1:77-1057(-)
MEYSTGFPISNLVDDIIIQIIAFANPQKSPFMFFDLSTVSKSWKNLVEKLCQEVCRKSPLQFLLSDVIPSSTNWITKLYCVYSLPTEFQKMFEEEIFIQNCKHDPKKSFSDWLPKVSLDAKQGTVNTSKTLNPHKEYMRQLGGLYYFEVEIVSQSQKGGDSCLGIGLASPGADSRKYIGFLPALGWASSTNRIRIDDFISIDGDLGILRSQIGTFREESRKIKARVLEKLHNPWLFTEGDVVGLGLEPLKNSVFFTMNGSILNDGSIRFPCSRTKHEWQINPCVSFHETRAIINPNFGSRKFAFDVVEYLKNGSQVESGANSTTAK